MSARTFVGVLALLATTLAPLSVAHAAGVNLSWDDCGASGREQMCFACDTNTGPAFSLVASFVPPVGTTRVTGEEVVIDLIRPQPDGPGPTLALEDWWKFRNAGSCRQTALSASIDFASADMTHCEDYWALNGGAGGIAAYITPYAQHAGRARLSLIFAVPLGAAAPLDPAREYYACRVVIARSRTVGAGACAGCQSPLEIQLSEIKLTQPIGVGDYRLQTAAHRSVVYWNQYGGLGCRSVPVRNSTWGAIKAQYR